MKLRWRLAWLFTYPAAKILLRLRVQGRENLLPDGQIIAANHTSNFDPLLIGWAAAREIYFLAKEELFRYRPFAWLISSWNALPVSRGGMDIPAFRRCSALLRQKQTLVLFPEGTRSRSGDLGEFKPGVGMLAVLNRVPIVPAHISGVKNSIISYWVDRDFVRKGWRQKPGSPWPIRSLNPLTVRFGSPVFPDCGPAGREVYERLTAEVFRRVQALAARKGVGNGKR